MVGFVAYGSVGTSPLRPGRTFAQSGPGLSGSGLHDAPGRAVSFSSALARPSLCPGPVPQAVTYVQVSRLGTYISNLMLLLPCGNTLAT